MEQIHLQAYRNGGGVYSLIGNHEIMNLMGDFRYGKDIKCKVEKNYGKKYLVLEEIYLINYLVHMLYYR